MYFTVTHLKSVIEYSEYMNLFEAIWKNRTESAGWEVDFVYKDEYTCLIFDRNPTDTVKNNTE